MIFRNIPKSKVISLFIILVTSLLLNDYYQNSLAIVDSYRGISFNSHGAIFTIIQLMLVVIFLLLLPAETKKPSDLASVIIFLFFYIPALLHGAHNFSNIWSAISLVAFSTVSYLSFLLFLKIPIPFIKIDLFSHQALEIVKFLLIVLIISYSIFQLSNSLNSIIAFDIQAFYEQRVATRAEESTLKMYILVIARSLILLWVIDIFFTNNSIWLKLFALFLVLIILLSQILVLFVRSHIFITFLIFLIGLGFKFKKLDIHYIAIGVMFIVLVCMFLDLIIGKDLFTYSIIRRIFILPGIISGFYIDFFLSFGEYFDFRETLALPYLVGGFAELGHFDMNMSSNMWSLSFGYYGLPGLLMTSFLAALILRIFDNFKPRASLFAYLSVTFICLIWVESSIWTSMLSSGIFFITMYFIILNYLSNITEK